jgi:catechol 2,3-dioxygenase-like lactoylglutathione lyase family enzyme
MERAYPILRIDDYEEAKSYYIDFLGFEIDFEWRHAEDFPVYMGISRGGLGIHLSEHLGEPAGRPGAAYLQVENVLGIYAELKGKKSDMTEEPIDQAWGSTELKLQDPFENRLTFTSPTAK